jgi:hypothetical protein
LNFNYTLISLSRGRLIRACAMKARNIKCISLNVSELLF